MAKNKSKHRKTSIIQVGKKLIRMGSYFAPEAATVLSEPNVQGAIKAITLKSGFDLTDGSWNLQRGLMAWAPGITFDVLDKAQAFIRRFISAM